MVKIESIHDLIIKVSPYYKKKGGPETQHLLVYDSPAETLEPIYFFLLDLMGDLGLKPEKLEDNFSSSVGSGHFSEFGQRISIMQQQGSKLLGDINMVLRSVLNIIYDLREFKIRLQSYEDLKDSEKKEAATLSLKQLWMDKVDMQKGNSGIKAMALGQAGFNTLLDAFLVVKDEKDVDKLDLNQVVKRILKPRIHEFNIWVNHSEGELRKRYEIEKTYLKSQVNSLRLYSRWAKPYLKAAQELEQRDSSNPALVKAFNTVVLEMSLLGKKGIDVKEGAIHGVFPKEFMKERFIRSQKREYFGCSVLDFSFRGIPQKTQGQSHYAFGGRAEIKFSSYALSSEELSNLRKLIDDSDLNAGLTLVQGTTEESLEQLKEDIDYFLKDEKQEVKKSKDNSNPFMALFGGYNEKKKEEKIEEDKSEDKKLVNIIPDNWYEKNYFRKQAAIDAKGTTYKLFETYKKANKMPTPHEPFKI